MLFTAMIVVRWREMGALGCLVVAPLALLGTAALTLSVLRIR